MSDENAKMRPYSVGSAVLPYCRTTILLPALPMLLARKEGAPRSDTAFRAGGQASGPLLSSIPGLNTGYLLVQF